MLEYILLGFLQGIFEWLPISSEGITALFTQISSLPLNPIDIAIFLHLGTLIAVLIFFRKEWQQILLLQNKELLKFLSITTIISLAIGFPLYSAIHDITIGSTLLLLMGFGLLLTSFFHKKKISFNLSQNKLALIAGALQGLAVIPGLSRSGSTIFGLSLGNLSPKKILTISYLMSAPVVLISSTYLLVKEPILFNAWPALIVSFIVGFLSLKLLMNFSQKINFFKFTLLFAILCFAGAIISFLF